MSSEKLTEDEQFEFDSEIHFELLDDPDLEEKYQKEAMGEKTDLEEKTEKIKLSWKEKTLYKTVDTPLSTTSIALLPISKDETVPSQFGDVSLDDSDTLDVVPQVIDFSDEDNYPDDQAKSYTSLTLPSQYVYCDKCTGWSGEDFKVWSTSLCECSKTHVDIKVPMMTNECFGQWLHSKGRVSVWSDAYGKAKFHRILTRKCLGCLWCSSSSRSCKTLIMESNIEPSRQEKRFIEGMQAISDSVVTNNFRDPAARADGDLVPYNTKLVNGGIVSEPTFRFNLVEKIEENFKSSTFRQPSHVASYVANYRYLDKPHEYCRGHDIDPRVVCNYDASLLCKRCEVFYKRFSYSGARIHKNTTINRSREACVVSALLYDFKASKTMGAPTFSFRRDFALMVDSYCWNCGTLRSAPSFKFGFVFVDLKDDIYFPLPAFHLPYNVYTSLIMNQFSFSHVTDDKGFVTFSGMVSKKEFSCEIRAVVAIACYNNYTGHDGKQINEFATDIVRTKVSKEDTYYAFRDKWAISTRLQKIILLFVSGSRKNPNVLQALYVCSC